MASRSVAQSESIAAFIPALELLITEAMDEWKIPRLTVAVVQNGEVALVRASDTSAATLAGCLRCPRTEAIHRGSSAYHSGLIPAALIMGHHLSISALCRAASASGVC